MKDIRLPMLKTIAVLLIGLALFLFFISLLEPVFITEDKPIKGFWIFAMGWMGFVIFQFAWYANLLSLLAALMMFKRPLIAFLLSLLALLLAAESFLFDEIPLGSSKESIAIIDTDIGLYLWIGAHCAILYAAILMLIRHKMIDNELTEQQLTQQAPQLMEYKTEERSAIKKPSK
jgi:hypothetical protein